MAAYCAVCQHPQLAAIQAKLKDSALPMVAALFELDAQMLERHRREHMQLAMQRAPVDALGLVEELRDLADEIQLKLKNADGITHRDYAALAAKRLDALMAIAKLTGAQVKLNPLDAIPLWGKIREVLGRALKPYPEARSAVEEAIARIEEEAG